MAELRSPDHHRVADAAEALFVDHFDAVFSFCAMRCGSRSDAEEVTAEVFADAVRQLRADPAMTLGRGWFITVARRRLIDHWRRHERESRRSTRLASELLVHSRHDSDDPASGEHVLAALESLSQRHRLALVLRYLDDLSVTEVADALDLSYAATESLLARSRRAFATSFNHHAGSTP